MSYDDFIGEMRKRGCSEPTAIKIWNGLYENYDNFTDNDIYLSNLRKAADLGLIHQFSRETSYGFLGDGAYF